MIKHITLNEKAVQSLSEFRESVEHLEELGSTVVTFRDETLGKAFMKILHYADITLKGDFNPTEIRLFDLSDHIEDCRWLHNLLKEKEFISETEVPFMNHVIKRRESEGISLAQAVVYTVHDIPYDDGLVDLILTILEHIKADRARVDKLFQFDDYYEDVRFILQNFERIDSIMEITQPIKRKVGIRRTV
jgi:hypothetical protein